MHAFGSIGGYSFLKLESVHLRAAGSAQSECHLFGLKLLIARPSRLDKTGSGYAPFFIGECPTHSRFASFVSFVLDNHNRHDMIVNDEKRK